MKILVTGGAGFIASHVSDTLLALGHDVAIVDNFASGKRENLPAGAAFYEVDIRDERLGDVFQAEKPDVVVHHAAHIEVARSVREPAYDASINILGSLNLLERCREHGVNKVIYAGTGGALVLYDVAGEVPDSAEKPICVDLAQKTIRLVGSEAAW